MTSTTTSPQFNTYAVLSLGANRLYPLFHLACARDKIKQSELIRLIHQTKIYKTTPWGGRTQAKVFNQLLIVTTHYCPEQLLFWAKTAEKECGRCPEPRWRGRRLDIDIVFFQKKTIRSPHLILPHPTQRREYFSLFIEELKQNLPEQIKGFYF